MNRLTCLSLTLMLIVVGILGVIIYWGNTAAMFGVVMFVGMFMCIPAVMWDHKTEQKAR